MERELLAYKTGDRSMLLWKMLDHPEIRPALTSRDAAGHVCSRRIPSEMEVDFNWPEKWYEYVRTPRAIQSA